MGKRQRRSTKKAPDLIEESLEGGSSAAYAPMSAPKPSAHAGWARPALLLGALLGALALLMHNTDLRKAAAALPVQLACGRRESDRLLIPRRPAVRLEMLMPALFLLL